MIFFQKLICYWRAYFDSIRDPQHPEYRLGVGIFLVNPKGRIFVGKKPHLIHWQMPQGGVDKGESLLEAAYREMQEEVGTQACQLMGEIHGFSFYDFPRQIFSSSTLWRLRFRGQKQKWFAFLFQGTDHEIDLTSQLVCEFSHWRWSSPDELLQDCPPFKRSVYQAVLQELWPVVEATIQHSRE